MSDEQVENTVDMTNELESRRARVDMWREAGVEPYGCRFDDISTTQELKDSFNDDSEEKQPAKIAGRVIAMRKMGKVIFATVKDPSGSMQVFAQKNALGEEQFNLFKKVDIGDIIGVDGFLFRTKVGEITVRDFKYTMLSKALRPMPEKWNGLKDIETRYRSRYLDLMSNDESREILVQRARIVAKFAATSKIRAISKSKLR